MKAYLFQLGPCEMLTAAESPEAALRKVGAHDEAFEMGEAEEAQDPELVALALGNPDAVFERPIWAWRKAYTRCNADGGVLPEDRALAALREPAA